jgi:hypothetical protein
LTNVEPVRSPAQAVERIRATQEDFVAAGLCRPRYSPGTNSALTLFFDGAAARHIRW